MWFGVLGPLLVRNGDAVVRVPAARHRALLAALLLQAGTTVSADTLAEIVWDGAPPPGAEVTLRSHVSRLRQALGPDVRERVVTRYRGYLIEASEEEVDLLRFRRTKCGVLSSGEQTRVALAKAMLNRPKLLLLDEPTASIDPATARDIRARIKAFAEAERGGVLWTSHNMYEVAEVCHRVLFLSRGKILLQGEPAALIREHGEANLEDLFVTVAQESLHPEGAA